MLIVSMWEVEFSSELHTIFVQVGDNPSSQSVLNLVPRFLYGFDFDDCSTIAQHWHSFRGLVGRLLTGG